MLPSTSTVTLAVHTEWPLIGLPAVAGHGGAGIGGSKWHFTSRLPCFVSVSVTNGPSLRNASVMKLLGGWLGSDDCSHTCTPAVFAGSTLRVLVAGTAPRLDVPDWA